MTPSAWIALASLAAVLFVQTAVVAFAPGRRLQRVTQVEKSTEGDGGMLEKVIRLGEKMAHVEVAVNKQGDTLQGINRQLGNIVMGNIGRGVEIIP